MPLTAGTRLGWYEVLSTLGAGGMGVVYRARDTRLQRDVAIKVLPDHLANDAERLARFEREAQALASLNHPNIAQVYGLEGRAIVMELVEGRTLGEAIGAGPIPLADALAVARQIAAALEAAHDRGIVHRDLKPDNIKINGTWGPAAARLPDGRLAPPRSASDIAAKVLDFGLAKIAAVDPASNGDALANSPTITSRGTTAGLILGTAAYMSPEQARGRPVDRRADVWAFAVVFAEMLTGERLFKGDDVSETLASVLARDPDLSRLPDGTPQPVLRLLKRCLEKDPSKRIRDIGDAIRQLDEDLATAPAPDPKRQAPRGWTRLLPWAATLMIGGAGFVYGIWQSARPVVAPMPVALSITPPESSRLATSSMSISPDGSRIAFVVTAGTGNARLLVRRLDALEAEEVPGAAMAAHPFWSPDGTRIGFFADNSLKVATPGGGVVTIAKVPAGGVRGGAWSERGDILIGHPLSGLLRVSDEGGEAVPATALAPGQVGHNWPQFLPGGTEFLVFVTGTNQPGTYRGTLGSPALSFVTGSQRPVQYVSPGFLLSLQGTTVTAQRYALSTGTLEGEPAPIATGAVGFIGVPPVIGTATTLAWISAAEGAVVATWLDRSGTLPAVNVPSPSGAPALSRDGTLLAMHRIDAATGTQDIWVSDVKRGTERRLTTDPAREQAPAWSPDGRRVAYASSILGATRRDLFVIAIDDPDAKPDPLLTGDTLYKTPLDWSRDGTWLLYGRNDAGRGDGGDLFALRLDDRLSVPVATSGFAELGGHFSPDGRWVAFSSNETGRSQVYVQAFPSRAQRTVISVDGGTWPTWRADGRELYFLGDDDRLMAVAMSQEGVRLVAGAPKALFSVSIGGDRSLRNFYDVAPDGRFLVMAPTTGTRSRPITVFVNWAEGLLRQ